ncbi:aromatic-ring-hydroxylating dioxygenase subunit beta [Streptomyces mayonensis]|uniref:aromatic-ring-hydroxylating dioxygenase subunit beta n=1 Tax=Streptomyces mayonensis TaxID=2750816 RepID=UPI001C1E288B|nr:aromatic-ring-hydroxylating dioxygenase subunit beta [Streptomyces sp. A108]MBU6529596.1 phenylpropionate dioxygenase [Streptomyces sp. A108]
MNTAEAPDTLTVTPATHTLVAQFLAHEARLLDEAREEEWFELLDDDLLYTVPSRQSTAPRDTEVDRSAWRIRDTKAHIRTRLARQNTGHAYSEVPPSRTMRLVGSIEVRETSEADVVEAYSALLLYRQRGIDVHFDLIPCRRNDRIRLTAAGPRLLSREVILTETSLKTANLGVFL